MKFRVLDSPSQSELACHAGKTNKHTFLDNGGLKPASNPSLMSLQIVYHIVRLVEAIQHGISLTNLVKLSTVYLSCSHTLQDTFHFYFRFSQIPIPSRPLILRLPTEKVGRSILCWNENNQEKQQVPAAKPRLEVADTIPARRVCHEVRFQKSKLKKTKNANFPHPLSISLPTKKELKAPWQIKKNRFSHPNTFLYLLVSPDYKYY